jgi:glutathione S-transferase
MKPTTSHASHRDEVSEIANKKGSQGPIRVGAHVQWANRKAVPAIELFQRESCPYSHRVRERLSKLGLDFVAHSVSEKDALKHKQLIQAGGKDQIPFLVDHRTGVKLYGSPAIDAYLENEYGEEETGFITNLTHTLVTRLRGRSETIVWAVRIPLEGAMSIRSDLEKSYRTVRDVVRDIRTRAMANSPAQETTSAKRSERSEATRSSTLASEDQVA